MGGAAQVLDEHDAQCDCNGPKLADRQGLHGLVSADEPSQRLGLEMAVGVCRISPGQAEDARVPREGAARQLRQQAIESRWQVLADLADLCLHQVVIVEQPFGGGSRVASFTHGLRDGAVRAEQHRLVVAQPHAERRAANRIRRHLLGGREAGGVPLETFDAEEVLAQDLLVVPRRHLRQASPRSPARARPQQPGWSQDDRLLQ